ncbi:hypothetical protein KSP39_PZI002174 [Platanthera zijinensis]|uniref:Uncharacterized protein n=1 Tax=Platanthera zijinensis TaxID=2320716 RepID=A0AAP0BZJ5_9ASPA
MQSFRRKQKTQIQKPFPAITPQKYRHSSDEPANPDNLQLRRSKSCGDGRASAPSDEFDITTRRFGVEQNNPVRVLYCHDSSSGETEEAQDDTFKCSALCLFNDESGPMSYFDLPLELIRCSGIDTCSPVKAGFVFDKDLKGVLKKSCDSKSGSRKSCDSTRHVRFSASAPTSYPASPSLSPCITPRLMRARDEFNALLEASSH